MMRFSFFGTLKVRYNRHPFEVALQDVLQKFNRNLTTSKTHRDSTKSNGRKCCDFIFFQTVILPKKDKSTPNPPNSLVPKTLTLIRDQTLNPGRDRETERERERDAHLQDLEQEWNQGAFGKTRTTEVLYSNPPKAQ